MHSLVISTFLIITSVALFHLKRIPIAFIIISLDKHLYQSRRILFYLITQLQSSSLWREINFHESRTRHLQRAVTFSASCLIMNKELAADLRKSPLGRFGRKKSIVQSNIGDSVSGKESFGPESQRSRASVTVGSFSRIQYRCPQLRRIRAARSLVQLQLQDFNASGSKGYSCLDKISRSLLSN